MTPKPTRRRAPRAEDVIAVTVLAVLAFTVWLAVQVVGLHNSLDTSNAARDALAAQVQHLGASPVAGPPGSRGAPGPAVTGPSGPSGPPGAQGPSGSPGASASPIPGPIGPAGSPGPVSTVPGPSGSPGATGASGAQGAPGPAGADGKDGAPGKDGTNGRDGANGAPPAGWTYTDPAGQTYTCSPVAGFDPQSPRYACTADQPAPPPSASHSLLGVVALASTAAYRRRLSTS